VLGRENEGHFSYWQQTAAARWYLMHIHAEMQSASAETDDRDSHPQGKNTPSTYLTDKNHP
jgi:hypothetical protein